MKTLKELKKEYDAYVLLRSKASLELAKLSVRIGEQLLADNHDGFVPLLLARGVQATDIVSKKDREREVCRFLKSLYVPQHFIEYTNRDPSLELIVRYEVKEYTVLRRAFAHPDGECDRFSIW